MTKRLQGRAGEALEGLSYWLRDNWKVVLLLLGMAGLFVAVGLWTNWLRSQPRIEEEAEVIRFGAYSREKGPIPVVLARLKDGRIVQLEVHRGRTHVCRAGSTIQVVRRGPAVFVGPRGCRPPIS